MSETPDLQWFRPRDFSCRMCGKRAAGNLMGRRNDDYGMHCRKCADKRLAAAKRVREEEARHVD